MSRRPQTRRDASSSIHVAVELHVISELAERGLEEEEAQAHPERGRVLEAVQEGVKGGRGRGKEIQAQGGRASTGEGGLLLLLMLHSTSVVGEVDGDALNG